MRRALLTLALLTCARSGAAQTPAAALSSAPVLMLVQSSRPAELEDSRVANLGMTSRLAPMMLRGSGQVPQLWLAQRTIDREWGPSDDSTYRTVEVQSWKSEGLALALSGALPGAGQLYTEEGSGWFYLLGEALGWAGRVVTRHKANQLRDQAAAFVVDPTDSASTWSFARYARESGSEATLLEALWVADRESFYQALASEPGYRSGFAGTNPAEAYDSYRGLHADSQDRFRQARAFERH